MTPSARVQAAIDLLDEIIVAARDGGAAADTLIARYFKTRRYAGSKDRRAVRDLIYRAIRRSGNRPETGRAAMLGLAQDDPEIIALFDGSTHGPAPLDAEEATTPASLIPSWLNRYLPKLLNDAERAALLERAPLDIRVNALKEGAFDALMAAFPDAQPIANLPDALRLPEGTALEQSEPYQLGMVEVQDVGSQWIARSCAARAGELVVDICAGAGGKTLALAADMGGEGRLIAADINRDRLSRLPDRAERAGASNVEILLMNGGKEAEAIAPFTDQVDAVLIDAPCSGTGTWRRNPESRWRLTPARLERLGREQAHILDFAATLVKPGGRIIYAVCSLTDAEGRAQIDAFLTRHEGWQAQTPDIPIGRDHGHGRLLTPAHDGTDGFFIATLLRS